MGSRRHHGQHGDGHGVDDQRPPDDRGAADRVGEATDHGAAQERGEGGDDVREAQRGGRNTQLVRAQMLPYVTRAKCAE